MESEQQPITSEVKGTAGLKLLDCDECQEDSEAKTYVTHQEHQWCIKVQCRQHPTHKAWWVCTTCSTRRKKMVNDSQIQRHNRIYHLGGLTKKAKVMPPPEEVEDSVMPQAFSEEENTDEKRDMPNLTFNFTRQASADFYQNEQNGLGAAYLVGYSTFHQKDVGAQLDKDEVELIILVTSLANTLTRGERAKLSLCFSKLLSTLNARNTKETRTSSLKISPDTTSSTKLPVTVPTNPSLMRSRIMEGSHAILANLPHPSVRWVRSDHAYVSLKDVIADFLAHGTPYEKIRKPPEGEGVKRAGESKHAQDIWDRAKALHGENPLVVLMLKRWRDDFQALKSNKGQKKGTSAWIGTVTISPPFDMKANSLRNTYPIAMGPKGGNHEPVEELFLEELSKFSKGSDELFFDKSSNQMTRVHAELFVSLADQPERRGTCYVQLGNSTYHPRFGFCCNIGALEASIRACNTCFQAMLKAKDGSPFAVPPCSSCTCWETTSESDILDHFPPPEYPLEELAASGKFRPYQMTFETLTKVVETAHNALVTETWKKIETAKVYLKTNCLSTYAVDSVIEHAQNAKSYRILQENQEKHPEAFEAITNQRNASPQSFEMWRPPSLWTSGLDFEIQIEACMHLLSGVIKAQTRGIQQWAACQNKKQTFVRYASSLLDPVQELQLQWCKCPGYTGGKLPGWVSENYMGLVRVSKWFYSGLPSLAGDTIFEEPENLPQNKWLKKHNKGWLEARGLDNTGSAAELKERVAEHISAVGGPPPLREPTGASVDDTMKLIRSLSGLVYRLMTNCVNESLLGDVERCVKIYLNRFCTFDELVYPMSAKKKASWLAKYNFPCLLNLVEILRRFGPLRNLWEGGYQGEGYLRKSKEMLSNGLRKNWQVNAILRMLESTALNAITDATCAEYNNYEESTTGERNFHVYSGLGGFHRKYSDCVPLSIVRLHDGTFGGILRNYHTNNATLQYQFVVISRGEHSSRSNGMDYFKWIFNLRNPAIKFVDLTEMSHFCLLLPAIVVVGEDEATFSRDNVYTLITSEWEEMLGNGTINLQPVATIEDH